MGSDFITYANEKLNVLFNFERKSKIKAGDGLNEGKYKFFTSSPIQNKFLDEYTFDKESLIFGTGGLPSIHYCNEKFSTSTDCFVVTCKSEKILPKYVYYYLLGNMQILERGFKGAGLKHISKKYLQNIDIIFPTNLSKQREIINELSNIESLMEYREESIKLLDLYLKSVFFKMFGDINHNPMNWNIVKIKDVTQVSTGKTPSRKNKNYWVDGSVPWVKTTEVKNSVINNTEEYISDIAVKDNKLILFPKNTILVAMYGQGKTRGRCGKLNISSTTNQACASILPSKYFNSDYLFYYLINSYKNLRNLGRGGNQPNLNLSMIRNFEVYLPPIELQNQFARIVQQVDEIKKYHLKSKIELENLLNNLMQKAFKEELIC